MSGEINVNELEKSAKLNLSEIERNEIEKYIEFLVADFDEKSACSIGIIGEPEPMVYGIELENVFREDKAVKAIDREELLENAPDHEDGYFKVPKTVE